ncbi:MULTISPECIES: hypothetical protein [unclassified Pseudomonas]|uniref:hypothetical protein n=1 Tax=unclassified Pseudomonas TaxID=196821 RepID=UPI0024497D57|nr:MULTISPECIES: hypothetical protein [unclassified Pseudomonas]MDG9926358.1 hypothetical protein [Pseudomonas sp. GD04045]MDH0037607.1 hypothetical protein [Pseudomonas sp. GD04019]
MKTVSFQGTQLSASERRRIEQQRQVRSFLNPHLTQQVDEALAAVDKLREEGNYGENPNKFRLFSETKSAPYVGDLFGLDPH